MQSLHQLLVLLVATAITSGGSKLEDNLYEDIDYEAFGQQVTNETDMRQDVSIPSCATDEFLTSNGTNFLCQRLRKTHTLTHPYTLTHTHPLTPNEHCC